MNRPLRRLRRVVVAPVRALQWLVTLPARAVRATRGFLNAEPEEHPLGDVMAELVQNPQARELFWEQVEVLRRHLLRSVLALAVAVGIALFFTPQLIAFLARPVGGISNLVAIEVTESIGVYMSVALLAGVALASPYIAFEAWLFVAPGLHPRERRYGLIGIPLAVLFFIAGLAFTYYIFLPGAIPWLLNVVNFQARLRPSSYFSFVTSLMFWIGLCFEYPLIVYVLTAMGILQPRWLVQYWRHSVVAISVIAAVITPTWDPVNMGLVMLPMVLLYFVSMGLSYVAYAGRSKTPEPATQANR